ncbi:MAG: hypothetical protein ACRD2D_01500 [Terriglobales bacterium]
MKPWEVIGSLALVIAAGAGVWLWRRWHRVSPEELERRRRLRLHSIGRITGGEILENWPPPEGEQLPPILAYKYEFGGVTYQASQALHLVAVEMDPQSWIPGWPVQVKFDPASPGNSIVVCEHWSGLSSRRARAATPNP